MRGFASWENFIVKNIRLGDETLLFKEKQNKICELSDCRNSINE